MAPSLPTVFGVVQRLMREKPDGVTFGSSGRLSRGINRHKFNHFINIRQPDSLGATDSLEVFPSASGGTRGGSHEGEDQGLPFSTPPAPDGGPPDEHLCHRAALATSARRRLARPRFPSSTSPWPRQSPWRDQIVGEAERRTTELCVDDPIDRREIHGRLGRTGRPARPASAVGHLPLDENTSLLTRRSMALFTSRLGLETSRPRLTARLLSGKWAETPGGR
jgi:hypothetical protein